MKTKTKDLGLYSLKNGYMTSLRVNRYTLDVLKALVAKAEEDLKAAEAGSSGEERVVAGKIFISPVSEKAKEKFPNPDTAPHFFMKYLTKGEVEEYANSKSQAF